MTTPTCRTCGTKFPGRDVCKVCGADPSAEPSIEQRVASLKKNLKPVTLALDTSGFARAMMAASQSAKRTMEQMRKMLAELGTKMNTAEFRKYQRQVYRAKERSMRNAAAMHGRGHGRQVR